MGRASDGIAAARQRYDDIVRQVDRQDQRYQHYVSTCALLNLAIATAAGALVKSSDLGVRDSILLALCGAAGLLITYVINHYIYRIKLHFRYLTKEYFKVENAFPDRFISPFPAERAKRTIFPNNWSRLTFLFLLLWIATIVAGGALILRSWLE